MMLVSIVWVDRPDMPDMVVDGHGPFDEVKAAPILDDNDQCIGILFMGLPPNVNIRSHVDVDVDTFDGSAVVLSKSDAGGVSVVRFPFLKEEE